MFFSESHPNNPSLEKKILSLSLCSVCLIQIFKKYQNMTRANQSQEKGQKVLLCLGIAKALRVCCLVQYWYFILAMLFMASPVGKANAMIDNNPRIQALI